MDTTQLNVEIPESLVNKMRVDAAKSGRSIKVLTAAILADFFDRRNWPDRQTLYAKQPSKMTGRPLASKAIRNA